MQDIIIKKNTRILTPREYKRLREELNPKYQIICDVLLYSGMRIEEFWAFCRNKDWYKPSRRCISLPKEAIRKEKCLITERDVILTKKGCDAVELLQKLKIKQVTRHAMSEALKLAASKTIGTTGITPKMFRKTCASWLMKAYPEKKSYIRLSMGHTEKTMENHYLGIAFAPADSEDIRIEVRGWGE